MKFDRYFLFHWYGLQKAAAADAIISGQTRLDALKKLFKGYSKVTLDYYTDLIDRVYSILRCIDDCKGLKKV